MNSQINTEMKAVKKAHHVQKKTSILGLTRDELEKIAQEMGNPAYRGRQLYLWLYKKFKTKFSEMTDLPKNFREKLEQNYQISPLTLEKTLTSRDGTKKFLFKLEDGFAIETVLIPSQDRNSLCISSQAGCPLGCKFCYTATLGPGRNLSASEIVAQFVEVSSMLENKITNVIFMGMGEPLLNLSNVIRAVKIFTDDAGINLGRRRITISTVGLPKQIIELARTAPVRLAISLHATTDHKRSQIIPINQKYPLKELFNTLKTYRELTPSYRHPITLEYLMIRGFNTSSNDAKRLVQLARSIGAKVNLIPYNEHPGAHYKRPTEEEINKFREILQRSKVRNTLRQTRGDDIFAACGQLALHHQYDRREEITSSLPADN